MSKQNRLAFILVMALSVFWGCKPKPCIVIEADIAGYVNKPVSIYQATEVYIDKPYGKPILCLHTDDNGMVNFSIKSKADFFFYLFTDDQQLIVKTPIFAKCGDSVGIKTSIYNLSTPEFSGGNAVFNQYMLHQSQTLSRIFRYNRVNEWTIDGFVCFADSVEKRYGNAIDSIAMGTSIDSRAVRMLKADLSLFMACKRFEFLRHNINETQGVWRYLIPRKDYYLFKDNLFDYASEFWYLPHFSLAVDAMLEDDYQNNPQVVDNPAETHANQLDIKLKKVVQEYRGTVKGVALAGLARRFPDYLSNPNFFDLLPMADSMIQGLADKPALSLSFKEQAGKVSAIKPGAMAPNLVLPDRDGKMVSLEQFRGEVVLLVFWGTWCPPCLASIPKYLEIVEKYEEQGMEVIFISLEARSDDVEGWRMFIEGEGRLAKGLLHGKPFPGVHLVAQGQFANPQVQPYVITYAPSYVLIDKTGRIAFPRISMDEAILFPDNN